MAVCIFVYRLPVLVQAILRSRTIELVRCIYIYTYNEQHIVTLPSHSVFKVVSLQSNGA